MKGSNSIELNQATMQEAVQMYLDSLMPKGAPQVGFISISSTGSTSTFKVLLNERDVCASA